MIVFLHLNDMSIYLESPFNDVDGIVIGYATWHKILNQYLKEHCWADILYSRSPEPKEELYQLAEQHKLYSLTRNEYKSLPMNKRPTLNRF